jgi:hypothetical protein
MYVHHQLPVLPRVVAALDTDCCFSDPIVDCLLELRQRAFLPGELLDL